MYGPISGNIPGLSVADSAIVFEFLAKVIKLYWCSICVHSMNSHLFIAIFIHRLDHRLPHQVLISFLIFSPDLNCKSKGCYDHGKACKIGILLNTSTFNKKNCNF